MQPIGYNWLSRLFDPAAQRQRKMEHDIDLGSWQLTEERILQYLEAVGDSPELYLRHGLAPPLALSAYALGALLEKLNLPPGTIHSLQEMEAAGPVALGQEIIGRAVLERPRQRAGLQFTTVTYTLQDDGGATVQTGKTTVLTPALDDADSSTGIE